MITLYQFEISPFCDKVRRILHVKRQPYTTVEISLSQTLTRLKKINPAGKVPAIEHDGHFVADSTDIARYLEERFPTPSLVPTDPRQRALCHVLEDWADESLYFFEMALRFTLPNNAKRWIPALAASDAAPLRTLAGFVVPLSVRRTLAAQGLGRKSTPQILDDLTRHVTAIDDLLGDRDWLVGDALTTADIAVFTQLVCIRGADEGAARIGRAPKVARWMERVDRVTAKPA